MHIRKNFLSYLTCQYNKCYNIGQCAIERNNLEIEEILIVDDGSTDRTGELADAYEQKYPGIVRAIHQENGGHGEAVNAGLRNATGLYFKVVDSDDWVDLDAYKKVLETLRTFREMENPVDVLLTNYVYEKVNQGKRCPINCSPTMYMRRWRPVIREGCCYPHCSRRTRSSDGME